jgi:hypothetical protein
MRQTHAKPKAATHRPLAIGLSVPFPRIQNRFPVPRQKAPFPRKTVRTGRGNETCLKRNWPFDQSLAFRKVTCKGWGAAEKGLQHIKALPELLIVLIDINLHLRLV